MHTGEPLNIQVGNIIDGVYEYTEDFSDEKTDLNKIETSDELGKLAVKLDIKNSL